MHAIIGSGPAAQKHIEAMQAVGEKVNFIFADDANEAARLAERYDIRHAEDPSLFLLNPDILSVSICVPVAQRAELAKLCAERGKSIIVDGPISFADQVAGSAIDTSFRSHCLLVVTAPERYDPLGLAILRAVRRGDIGEVQSVAAKVQVSGRALATQSLTAIEQLVAFAGRGTVIRADSKTVGSRGSAIEARIAFDKKVKGLLSVVSDSSSVSSSVVEVVGTAGSVIFDTALPMTLLKAEGLAPDVEQRLRALSTANQEMAGRESLVDELLVAQFEDFLQARNHDYPIETVTNAEQLRAAFDLAQTIDTSAAPAFVPTPNTL